MILNGFVFGVKYHRPQNVKLHCTYMSCDFDADLELFYHFFLSLVFYSCKTALYASVKKQGLSNSPLFSLQVMCFFDVLVEKD